MSLVMTKTYRKTPIESDKAGDPWPRKPKREQIEEIREKELLEELEDDVSGGDRPEGGQQ